MADPINELDAYVQELRADAERAYHALQGKEKLTGCTSYVQRTLGIGYNRAAAVMLMLEQSGLITTPGDDGARAWTV